MSVDSFTRVIDVISNLVGAVLWPVVVLIVVARLLPDIRKVLDRGGFNFKAPGVELSVERATEAAAALGAAANRKGEDAPSPKEVAAAISGGAQTGRPRPARVLWVDDHPENNEYERQAMSALGIDIELAHSTKQAVERVPVGSYDLVISDLGRQSAEEDDADAGLSLLKELRRQGFMLPYIIYAGSRAVTERARLLTAGAILSTNSPTELVRVVVNLLSR